MESGYYELKTQTRLAKKYTISLTNFISIQQQRLVHGAVDNIRKSLEWAGLEYDYGPGIGGPHATYFQVSVKFKRATPLLMVRSQKG